MISRVSAGILLICAVLLHVVTPLCVTPGTPRAAAAVVAAENSTPHTAVIVASADGAGLHHDEYDPRNHPSRLAPLSTHAPAGHGGGGTGQGGAPDEVAGPPPAASAGTARHSRNPGAAPAPTLSALQSFRC
ncbi:hypothetical protein [Streptomyces pacificus]|uniref:Uncharacterized protein n=1 Tax=Streptomyces pacificus TaxID=2705029 RepID=A0A6A0AYX8_9ACTN|nr:hypothetical protein [Streptomyces pacificus]GFH37531.1 hypothetical protein SCWH03_37690 [Streptomyces pacificus]